MDLDQLRTFLAVLQHRSFSRAAQALKLGQSTVSFHVAALETSVGARLLDRKGGKLKLTESGATVERYASRILALRSEALARIRAEEAGETGRLTLAVSTIPAEHLLPKVLARFSLAHPKVNVRVQVSDSQRATDALLGQHADLAVVGSARRDRRLLFTAFAEDEIVLVGRAHAPLTARRPSGEELSRVRLIVREEGSGTRAAVGRFLAVQGSSGLPPLELGSVAAAKQCVLEGVGLALLSRRSLERELASGELTVLGVAGLPVRRRFYLVRPKGIAEPTAARRFAHMLLQEYR